MSLHHLNLLTLTTCFSLAQSHSLFTHVFLFSSSKVSRRYRYDNLQNGSLLTCSPKRGLNIGHVVTWLLKVEILMFGFLSITWWKAFKLLPGQDRSPISMENSKSLSKRQLLTPWSAVPKCIQHSSHVLFLSKTYALWMMSCSLSVSTKTLKQSANDDCKIRIRSTKLKNVSHNSLALRRPVSQVFSIETRNTVYVDIYRLFNSESHETHPVEVQILNQ